MSTETVRERCEPMHSHYKPLVRRTSFARLRRLCDALDKAPELWQVYGDDFRMALTDVEETLERRREAMDKRCGSARSGAVRKDDRTTRAQALADRKRLWSTRPHICEECGLPLTPNIARVHHIQEVQDGGSSEDSNCTLLCLNCNAKKHTR